MRDKHNERNLDSLRPFLQWVRCDLCGQDNYKILYPSTYTEKDFPDNLVNSFKYASSDRARGNIVRCLNCGLVYMNPRDKDIPAIYESVDEDKYYLSSEEERKITSERDLKQLESLIGSHKGRRLLDVGCSYGFFLDVAKNHGWEVYGCELSKKQCQFASRKHPRVYCQELKKCPFQENFFDVITLFDVIEHLSSPSDFLESAYGVLKKNGTLVTVAPDLSSLPARVMGKYWLNFARMHLYYFEPNTIRELYKKSGFQIIKVVRHRRILRLGVVAQWMSKYPLLYRTLHFFLNNRLMSNIKVSSALSGNMTVYARKL